MSEDALQFPCELAKHFNASTNYIANLKRLGCTFMGRRSSVRWVREFMESVSRPPTDEHHQHQPESTPNAQP